MSKVSLIRLFISSGVFKKVLGVTVYYYILFYFFDRESVHKHTSEMGRRKEKERARARILSKIHTQRSFVGLGS